MNRESKLQVVLFSDSNFLALNILEQLLTKNCVVNIVSDEKMKWAEKIKHIPNSSKFSLLDLDEYKKLKDFSYTVFCGGFINKKSAIGDFKRFISNKNFGTAKTLAIFPFETFLFKTDSSISISDNAGVIYLGDVMGQRIDLNSDLLIPSLINEMATQRKMTLGDRENFYPVFVADVARTVVKWLLSFGPYGKDTFLLGRPVSGGDFWKQNLKSFPGLKLAYDTKKETRIVPKGYETITINSNLNICLNETYKWIVQNRVSIKPPTQPKKKSKSLTIIFSLASLVFLFPLITTAVSGIFLYMSYRQFLSEKIGSAQTLSLVAKTTFTLGKKESDVLGYIPILGNIYKETSYLSLLGETLSDISMNTIPIAEDGRQILGNVLGVGIYDTEVPSAQIKSGLTYIYQELSFFQLKTQEGINTGLYSARRVSQFVDFDKLKTLFREGSVVADNLPSLLGQGANKNYLVLFENNMELRPTGGFIGSYGVASFGGGKMNGLNINDIYSADGQLKGHVDPPSPIKTYLGEANWFFRDSNWNPDFPTSSERAEWFLNKEMDQKVDGVVAVDLEPIKNILGYTKPIFLPDYNLTITPDNLYEKTQEEAQANTFAGSRQKASFLTALSRALISEVSKMNSKDRIMVLKALYESLSARHLQIYLHNQDVANAFSKLGWDGSVQSYSCGEGCYSDFFGDVEANVGVNKSNYFVSRKMNFNVNFGSQKITRDLTLNLTNSANPSLGLSGIYKNYVRIMIPSDATMVSVKSVIGQTTKNLSPEIIQEKGRQEVGVYIEVTPKASSDLVFEWQSNLPTNPVNSYGLFVRKQAGVDPSPLSVEFTGKGGVEGNPVFSLTKGGPYTYNTNLVRDFFARLNWKN